MAGREEGEGGRNCWILWMGGFTGCSSVGEMEMEMEMFILCFLRLLMEIFYSYDF